MYTDGKLCIATQGDTPVYMIPKMANRHGLIAGATGTGKTCTLKEMAESFSEAGVPVFMADVKGDLAATCRQYPVTFWDIYGQKGLPLRTTITEMGPTLLARLMGLTQTQEDVLTMVFKIADDNQLLLLDTKDLKSMISYVAENNKTFSTDYGNLPKATLNVILRGVIAIEDAGGEQFFGEPALDIKDWFRQDTNGKGMINILDSSTLINQPKIYSTFMLWMMSELFEVLPEAGDLEKPKMVFFFDEAHLLFNDAPKALLAKIEQVVKLVRSKGVGIYFITQNPKDIPDGVLAQLGNKVQHALHAYTPADQKGVKAAAESFRENPEFDTKEVIQQLGIGEALVSFLQEDGTPAIVQRVKINYPTSDQGPIDDDERKKINDNCLLTVKYSDAVDRDSAYEFLLRKKSQDEADALKAAEEEAAAKQKEKEEAAAAKQKEKEEAAAAKAAAKEKEKAEKEAQKAVEKEEREKEKAAAAKQKARKNAVTSVAKTAGGTVGREVGNTIGSAIGGKFGKKLGGNLGASLGRGILGTILNR